MDDLLHFVRHEVAMDGDDGTPIDRLDSFLHTFYARAAASSSSSTASTSSAIHAQTIDDSFKDFVWKQLASLPELTVAFLRRLDEPSAPTPDPSTAAPSHVNGDDAGNPSTPALIASDSNAFVDEDGNPIDQGTFNLKNKAAIKEARKNDQTRHRDARLTGEQYEFVEIPEEEIQSSTREQLLEKYGTTLRIAADPETCYVALTGSHERYGRLTPLAYQILQAIARGREDGKTVVDLGKEFTHDQKSLFHFVKSLCDLNLIVKMKVLASRTLTSRCIHRHYLETSEHWATWMTKDPNEANARGDDDEDDMSKSTALTIMTVAHINSNEPFVRSRIINALKTAPENLIPHVDLVYAIGFHARPHKDHRRRINRIITTMEKQGLVEKVGVARQGARGLLSCLKLRQNPQIEGENNAGNAHIPSEEDEVEERPNVLITLPVERQVVDLLVGAGHQGLTIRELQAGLGDVGIRTLETLLTRLEKGHEPPHLCDFRIQSVFETHGREKRLRYFTVAGYHERCRQDGLSELASRSDWSHPDLAGGFCIIDKSEFYSTPQEFAAMAQSMQTNANGKAKYKPKTVKPKIQRDPSQPAKLGRPKGSKKAAKAAAATDGNGKTPAVPDGEAGPTEGKTSKKRQKIEKVEGEEGQPPKKKGRPRKSQAEADQSILAPAAEPTAEQGKEATATPVPESQGVTPSQPAKKKGRPRKSKVATEATQPAPVEVSVQAESEGDQAGSQTMAPVIDVPESAMPDQAIDTPKVIQVDLPASSQPKKRSRSSKVHEGTPDGDGPSPGPGKKRKAELDESGMTVKGRPRKYPPGTTSLQRKLLLEERRAAGLEPPSKKKKLDRTASETGSVPSECTTPASELARVTAEPAETRAVDLDSNQVPPESLAIESAKDIPSSPEKKHDVPAPPILETLSLASDTPKDDAALLGSTSSSADQSAPPPPMLPDSNAPVKEVETLPCLPESVVPATDTVSTTPSAPPKKRGRPRKSVPVPVPSAEPVVLTETALEEPMVVSAAPDGDRVPELNVSAGQRRSKRQKAVPAAVVTKPVVPRRGRSSKNQIADAPVKVEDAQNDVNASEKLQSTAQHDTVTSVTETTQHMPPSTTPVGMLADSSKSFTEASSLRQLPNEEIQHPRKEIGSVSQGQDIMAEDLTVQAMPARQAQAAEKSVKRGRHPRQSGKKSLDAVITQVASSPQLPETARDTSEVREAIVNERQDDDGPERSPDPVSELSVPLNAGHDVQQKPSEMPTDLQDLQTTLEPPMQLPAMPAPLPGSLTNISLAADQESVTIAPNVIAKQAELDTKQEKGPERRNHSMQVHENEYIATLNDVGGIAEEGIPLNKLWQEYMQRKDPGKPPPRPLDRRTMKLVSTTLEKRGLVKRSILQFQSHDGKMTQRNIMYLASITLDSPQMREFALIIQAKLDGPIGTKNWLSGRKTIDKTSELVVPARPKKRGPKPTGEIPTDPRPFFLKNWRVVAQYFGWQYGFIARARTLHEYLVRSITDANDSTFIISSDPTIRIFSAPFVVLDTPMSVFIRIAAVSEYSEDLKNFLEKPDSLNTAIKQLPAELSGLFGAKKPRGYSRFSQLFETLMILKLLVPLEQVEHETKIVAFSGVEREPRYFAPKQDRSGATYWLLPSQAPLYDLQEKWATNQNLLGQLPISTPEEAARYWETLEKLTFGTADPTKLPPAEPGHPPTMNALPSFIHSARSSWHWRSGYLLLAQQKTYLRRILEEAPSKDVLLADETKLQQLAYNICAPVQAVQAYYAKPRQGARPEWAKRRKRRFSRKDLLDNSNTSASEADGPVAPPPRSQRTDKTIAKGKKDRNAGEGAAAWHEQQRIIAKRAQGASEAKEAVWNGILKGFRMQHGDEALRTVEQDFLHSWFISPQGPTASTIQQHLQQAAEGVRSASIRIPYRSASTYKTGSIINRSQDQRMNLKLSRKEVPAMHTAAPIGLHNLPDLPEVTPSGDKKTAKAGWTAEEDEQLVDLYVILQSRANDRDTKLSMEPATLFYPGCKAKLLVERLRRLAAKPGEVAYLDALQEAWSELWHNNQIKDPLLHEAARNVTREGLLLLRRLLNGVLNKQSLRFQAIMPADAASASSTRLPMNPTDLEESYIIEPRNAFENPENSQTWAYLWSTITTAQKSAKLNYQAFSTSFGEVKSAEDMSPQDRLEAFRIRYQRLDKLPSDCIKDGNAFAERLADEGEVEWLPICEDGDMLAVSHLFSDDLLEFSIDTSVTRAGRPYTDYRTRKIDDDNFENALTIRPNERFNKQNLPLFTIPGENENDSQRTD